MIRLYFTFILSLFTLFSLSQTLSVLTEGTQTSLRGLCVVNDKVLWASGSNGTVARSVNGGKTFTWFTVAGHEKRDFRDVEAVDSNTAVIMAVAEPAVILQTTDGGKSWHKVFEDTTKGMFLDAMDFDGRAGVVVGDPINGRLFTAETQDGGKHWQKTDNESDSVVTGEAMFASSGTNVIYLSHKRAKGDGYYAMVTGGLKSELIKTGKPGSRCAIPVVQGKESTGANSIAINNRQKMVVVGGDFSHDRDTIGNCAVTDDFGATWLRPKIPPHGYRSCVAFINSAKLITCGTSGVDISYDGGNNWALISTESFHVCGIAKKGKAIFLAGKDGRIAKLSK